MHNRLRRRVPGCGAGQGGRVLTRAVAALVAALLVTADGSTGGSSTPSGAYRSPVTPLRVLRAFQAPASRFGPGHRGVDLAVPGTGVVRAAAAGVVTFAGRVAGRGVVVVLHPDGVRTEYEPVRAGVTAGEAVAAGQPVGRLAGTHPGCPVVRCLHWGARRGDAYLDPLLLLRSLGPVRLLPWDGPP